jgi:hypothetical protein
MHRFLQIADIFAETHRLIVDPASASIHPSASLKLQRGFDP